MDDIGIRASADNGVGLVAIEGLVDSERAGVVLASNHRWVERAKISSQIVCYATADLLVEPEALCSAATKVASSGGGGLLVPTALVVQADRLDMWRRYCWLMSQAGVMRAAFTDWPTAQRWAAYQAALWAAQVAHRSREQ